ncbi:hypothetical protein BCR44DRAFT_58318 [Catenaria anguillulae PL171]|uniref:Uncharacterized protein n=1 Tax=Catenaria anguillulae PL171 TaxID=765915 RepID=A0A1Y2HVT1_9FUNG|nr:hypothetical protein BCR44DRAFT_58318 [Catenaria anguillulae PL171]
MMCYAFLAPPSSVLPVSAATARPPANLERQPTRASTLSIQWKSVRAGLNPLAEVYFVRPLPATASALAEPIAAGLQANPSCTIFGPLANIVSCTLAISQLWPLG